MKIKKRIKEPFKFRKLIPYIIVFIAVVFLSLFKPTRYWNPAVGEIGSRRVAPLSMIKEDPAWFRKELFLNIFIVACVFPFAFIGNLAKKKVRKK